MRGLALFAVLAAGCSASTPEPGIVPIEDVEGHFCTKMGCSSGITWVARLPTAVTGTIEVEACRKDECVAVSANKDFTYGFDSKLAVQVRRLGTRTVEVDVRLSDDRHGTDGVPFKLRLVDSGFTLLEVVRTPIYGERWFPNGRECDEPHDYWCRSAELDVWTTSQTALACTGIPVVGAATVEVPHDLAPSDLASSTVVLCRGRRCGHAVFDSFPCGPGRTTLEGEIAGTFDWTCDAGVVHAKAQGIDDPADLANGDVWRLEVFREGATTVDVSKTATYVEDFPNGPACDAYPRRIAE